MLLKDKDALVNGIQDIEVFPVSLSAPYGVAAIFGQNLYQNFSENSSFNLQSEDKSLYETLLNLFQDAAEQQRLPCSILFYRTAQLDATNLVLKNNSPDQHVGNGYYSAFAQSHAQISHYLTTELKNLKNDLDLEALSRPLSAIGSHRYVPLDYLHYKDYLNFENYLQCLTVDMILAELHGVHLKPQTSFFIEKILIPEGDRTELFDCLNLYFSWQLHVNSQLREEVIAVLRPVLDVLKLSPEIFLEGIMARAKQISNQLNERAEREPEAAALCIAEQEQFVEFSKLNFDEISPDHTKLLYTFYSKTYIPVPYLDAAFEKVEKLELAAPQKNGQLRQLPKTYKSLMFELLDVPANHSITKEFKTLITSALLSADLSWVYHYLNKLRDYQLKLYNDGARGEEFFLSDLSSTFRIMGFLYQLQFDYKNAALAFQQGADLLPDVVEEKIELYKLAAHSLKALELFDKQDDPEVLTVLQTYEAALQLAIQQGYVGLPGLYKELGGFYLERGRASHQAEDKGGADLKTAIETFDLALSLIEKEYKEKTTHGAFDPDEREQLLSDWADLKHQKGIACMVIGNRSDDPAFSLKASECFEDAQTVITKDAAPARWLHINSQLAQVLSKAGAHYKNIELLERSLHCSQVDLESLDKSKNVAAWINRFSVYANTLMEAGLLTARLDYFNLAIDTYTTLLEEPAVKKQKHLWADFQQNLGVINLHLFEANRDTAALKAAVAAFESSLSVRLKKSFPLKYATLQSYLGQVFQCFTVVDGKKDHCVQAVEYFEECLSTVNVEKHFDTYLTAKIGLEAMKLKRAKLETDTALIDLVLKEVQEIEKMDLSHASSRQLSHLEQLKLQLHEFV